MDFTGVLPHNWTSLVTSWLDEDIPSFDVGGFTVGSRTGEAHLLAKSPGVLTGLPFAREIFRQLGCTVTVTEGLAEGMHLDGSGDAPIVVAKVAGPVRSILQGERTCLNVMARASGIATRAASVVAAARKDGYTGAIAGTRKTTPGFRLVEKYALLVGGADTHRYDLSSMVMLKDNHIWAHGNITEAVRTARRAAGFSTKIEVEARSEAEAEEAIDAGADVVMLDNFDPAGLREAAARLKAKYRGQRAFLLECSGGLTPENLGGYLNNDVDVFSMGSLTQGAIPHVDYSLKIQRESIRED